MNKHDVHTWQLQKLRLWEEDDESAKIQSNGHVDGPHALTNQRLISYDRKPQLRKYSPTKLCEGAQMAIFGDFFASCICSEPCAVRFRPAS